MSFKKYIVITLVLVVTIGGIVVYLTPQQKKKVEAAHTLKDFEAQATWQIPFSLEHRIYTELEDVLIVGYARGFLAIDKLTGDTLWKRKVGSTYPNYEILVRSPDQLLICYDQEYARIDPKTGGNVWSKHVYTHYDRNVLLNDSLILISDLYHSLWDTRTNIKLIENLSLLEWETAKTIAKCHFNTNGKGVLEKPFLEDSTQFKVIEDLSLENHESLEGAGLFGRIGMKNDTLFISKEIDLWLGQDTAFAKISLSGNLRLEKAAIQFGGRNRRTIATNYNIDINCLPQDLTKAIQLRDDCLVLNDLIEKDEERYERRRGTFHVFDMQKQKLLVKYLININTKFASSASNLIALERGAKFDQLRIIDWSSEVVKEKVYMLDILKLVVDMELAIDEHQAYFVFQLKNKDGKLETKLYAFPLDNNGLLQLN